MALNTYRALRALPPAPISTPSASSDSNPLLATSGAGRLCLNSHRPMMVTDVPFFSDLDDEVTKLPADVGPQDLASEIEALLDDAARRGMQRREAEALLDKFSWPRIACRHTRLYRMALALPLSAKRSS